MAHKTILDFDKKYQKTEKKDDTYKNLLLHAYANKICQGFKELLTFFRDFNNIWKTQTIF